MDLTGLLRLQEVIRALRQRGVRVMLCEANTRVLAKLAKVGLLAELGAEGYFAHVPDALAASRLAPLLSMVRGPS